ncbi:MAG: glycosyltransferase [Verrucomicrobia bacterium]|nr:glycosyltransferase [Verrucomicrobiota bacterium]
MPLSILSSPRRQSPSGAELRCSVIVPVFHGGEHLSRCLASLAAALRPLDELIVVANGEGDGTWRMAQNYQARIVHIATNDGPATARNAGGAAASGDILFFTDPDVTVYPDCFARIAEAFRADKELAALIGSYDDAPAEQNFVSQFKNLFNHYVHQHGAVNASTFWGACGAIRRRVFLALGGFDESYARSSIEDIELGYRLRAAGHRIQLEHDLQVKHWKKWDAFTLIKSDFRDRAVPWTELILDQLTDGGRVALDLNLGRRYQISLLTSAAIVLAFIATPFFPLAVTLVPLLGAAFLVEHRALLRFFGEKKDWPFCLGAIVWRLIYDLCSLAGLLAGTLRFVFRKLVLSETPDDVSDRSSGSDRTTSQWGTDGGFSESTPMTPALVAAAKVRATLR